MALFPGALPDSPSVLSYAAHDADSTRIDWRSIPIGDWRYYEGVVGENQTYVYPFDLSEYREATSFPLQERAEGPMMSYVYDLPGPSFQSHYTQKDLRQMATAIASLPLCVVELPEELHGTEYGLALTAGGMDLTWEIAEAYIRLGYYPPVEFTQLPDMAGRGDSKDDQLIVDACRKTLEMAKERADRQLQAFE